MLENNAVVSANLALYPILNYHKIIKVEFIDVNYYINFEEKYLKRYNKNKNLHNVMRTRKIAAVKWRSFQFQSPFYNFNERFLI